MNTLAKLDHRYIWHPFTQMRDWVQREPILIVRGSGAEVWDGRGRRYLDANSSIWTNLHGHSHPGINAAIRHQLRKIAHSSALGLANEPASLLARELVRMANPKLAAGARRARSSPGKSEARGLRPSLSKVFFSDDGSTAMEVALKLAYEFARRTGRSRAPRFLSLTGAYHGDTLGAVALGHIDLFHTRYSRLLFKTDQVMSPYCYRCPFNRAKPERADARLYRRCNWECLDVLEKKFRKQSKKGNPYAGFVFEPLLQGAAGMIPQPAGWLNRAGTIAREYGALLIADEIMTAFGRVAGGPDAASEPKSGTSEVRGKPAKPMLCGCHHERVQPDFMALAKGMTGGYLPMAATLTTDAVFNAFLGNYDEFKTFFHGHSYTANQLGAAASLANLELLQSPGSIQQRNRVQAALSGELQALWRLQNVGDIRQCGLVVGIELVRDWRTREPFDLRERAGIRVCDELARRGVLTRPIGNVLVLMPPYCTTLAQLGTIVDSFADSIEAALSATQVR